jgi:hypothetical protein
LNAKRSSADHGVIMRISKREGRSMPPLFIPPVIAGALGALGAVALARIVAREWRRVNAHLHPPEGPIAEGAVTKLARDPETGVYRPE